MSDPISLGDAQARASADRLWTIRGKAIQAYANLEQSLCFFLGSLADISPEVAAIIFFRIVNTGARTVILEKLLQKRHNDSYHDYWHSFEKLLRQTDQERNEIIHWNAVISVNRQDGSSELTLMPPNIFGVDSNTPRATLRASLTS